jgi:hypothetical protein
VSQAKLFRSALNGHARQLQPPSSSCCVAGEVVQECAEWPCEAAAAAIPGAKRAEMIPKYPCQRTMGMYVGHTRSVADSR